MNRKYDQNNVFAKILRAEIPCKKIYEDEQVFVFHDVEPRAPIHVLVIPKKECVSFNDFVSKSNDQEIAHFFKIVQEIANSFDVTSYKIVANCGEEAGQVVFHYHLHILGYK